MKNLFWFIKMHLTTVVVDRRERRDNQVRDDINIINDIVGFNDVFASDVIADAVVNRVERRLDICRTQRSLTEQVTGSQHGHEAGGIGRCANGGNLKFDTTLS